MVGSGATDGSNEAVGMMALHEALRTVCLDSDWTYSVFWTIRPRIRVRGGNGSKVGDDSGSLMLMWEDGFCRGRVSDCLEEDPVRKAFSKMSIQLYNYGEGLMGKVASDKCHKWVFKEPSESEPTISSYWQSSFDSIPSEWTDQFDSGIQTIAVIQAAHGLLQLGSCMIIHEDLQFVLRMRHMFESLAYQSGFFLSNLFASSSSSPLTLVPARPPPNFFNWPAHQPMHSPHFPISTGIEYLQPNSSEIQLEAMTGEEKHENEIKWPSGLSLFDALAGQDEAARLLLDNLGSKHHQIHHQMIHESDETKRSDTLASKMDTTSSSSSPSIRHQNPEEGLFQDVMETFLK